MDYSDSDIVQLKGLLALLKQTFPGATFGNSKVDDMADALERAISVLSTGYRRVNLRCIFGHDRMRVPHLPGYGFACAWVCRRCDHHFPGFRYPPAPPMPRLQRTGAPPRNEER